MTYLGYPTAFLPVLPSTTTAAITSVASPLSVVLDPSPLLSSTHLISASDIATADVESARVFEAVAPDSSFLAGFGIVVVLCIVAGYVWANEVVPVSRTKLAISKSRGEVREYLDGLKTSDDDAIANEFNATTIEELGAQDIMENNPIDQSIESTGDGRGFERWLFSDWLNKPDAKGGRQKEPALPILKDAKWNSGDNPVLVTAAIMMLGVVLASITERVAT